MANLAGTLATAEDGGAYGRAVVGRSSQVCFRNVAVQRRQSINHHADAGATSSSHTLLQEEPPSHLQLFRQGRMQSRLSLSISVRTFCHITEF